MGTEEVKYFYNNYTIRQVKTGVNARHKSIYHKLINFGLKKTDTVMEIGCGIGTQSGLILKYLSKSGSLTAYDLSDESIEIAQKLYYKYENAEFIVADVTEMELSGNYDVIVLPDVIEHIPLEKHNKLFKKLHEVLKQDGFLFIHMPFPFYQDWLHENKPELLQIIDQPVHLPKLATDIHEAGFFIETMQSYSVFTRPFDYQYFICKRSDSIKTYKNIEQKITILSKIKYKLRHRGKNQ